MRSDERIDRICKLLCKCWHEVPDWRLGQLLVNALDISDPYYVEDDITEERLSHLLEEIETFRRNFKQ